MYRCCRALWNDDIYSNQRKGTLQNIKREDEDKDKDSGGRERQQARSQHAQFSTGSVRQADWWTASRAAVLSQ